MDEAGKKPDMTEILRAVSALYYAIYEIDIANDRFSVVRASEAAESIIGGCTSFTEACRKYIDACVCPDDAQNVRRFASTSYLGSVLTEKSPSCHVELRRGRSPKYQWIAINLIATEFSEGRGTKAVLAAENIDGLKSSMYFVEQSRMQSYARRLAADADRRIRSMTEKNSDERSAMLLKMNSRSRLLYLALQKTSAQAFEYDVAADRLSVVTEWSDSGDMSSFQGGADAVSRHFQCSERDTLAIENAFNAARDGEDASAEFSDNSGDERRYIRMNLYAMRVDGAPTGTVAGVMSDITSQRETELQAREESEFRRATLGGSAYGLEICLKANTWRYLWHNDAVKMLRTSGDYDAALMSGFVADTVAREDFSAFIAAMNRHSLLEAYESGKRELELDYRACMDGDGYAWFRNSVHLLEDAETGEIKANVYVSDINEQKLRAIAEAAAKQRLEERAKAEKRANELKSKFLTSMSHELRTPLNAMLGMTQLALREEMSPEARSYVHGVRTAGTGLLGVVNGILDLARIETGKLEITEGEYRPMELMNSLAAMFSFQAGDRSLDFVMEMDPLLPSVLIGDDGHMRQVFINLINNALKFTETGSITVSMGFRPAEDGAITLTACVADTGVGIKPERLPGIFEQFSGDDADEEPGTGLGLPISRRLVRLMGGELTAESMYGSGSTFSFELPQRVADAAPGGPFVRRDGGADDDAFWSFCAPDATVMIVDDNTVNLRVGLGLLRPFGMRVITAAGGEEALRLLENENVDLILMDQMMPDMDGLETARRIRAMGGAFEKLPILALTANAMKGVKEHLLSNGMDDYMSKPVEMWELSEKLRHWLPAGKVVPQRSPEVPVTKEWPVNLPDIPGVDVARGLSYMCTFGDYMTCLRDFWSIIPEKSARLEELAVTGELGDYTAEAHSLKSSSRLIGADALADLAAKLEKLGHEGRTDEIRRENGKLLSLYRSYSEKLEPALKTDAAAKKLRPITAGQYAAKLRELSKYVGDFDCDSADHWSDYMRTVKVPDEYASGLDRLHMFILAAKFTSCSQLIGELLEEIG
jgi:signal transduction histidine kinase/ActR/RegA family two-component response regulator/HPt (histidine-containing phosphotransfer) domain-containing protein